MFGWVRDLFRGSGRSGERLGEAARVEPEPMSLRRFEAAETSRLNSAHWSKAHGLSLNSDLTHDLERLGDRCEFEVYRNPYVRGVMETWVTALCGGRHPTLDLHARGVDTLAAESAERKRLEHWLAEAESGFREWWKCPDVNGVMSGSEMLRQGLLNEWTRGGFLWQLVTASPADTKPGEVRLRLHAIAMRRLSTPMNHVGDGRVVLGIERDEKGRPLTYFIRKGVDELAFANGALSQEHEPIPAKDMIHFYECEEPGQMVGVPLCAVMLQPAADLRDFDVQVMDAARAAAHFGVVLHTEHQDAPFVDVAGSMSLDRLSMMTAPPGWKPVQMTPEQPSTTYVDYRVERHAELGRAVNMPGMLVRLDSKRHNYSSARFDDQQFDRTMKGKQARLETRALQRVAKLWLREFELLNRERLGPAPKEIEYLWSWPARPHVDRTKEANADVTELDAEIVSESAAVEARGVDYETHLDRLARDRRMREARGLGARPSKSAAGGEVGVDEEAIAGVIEESARWSEVER